MRDHTGCIRGYYRSTKAYYAKNLQDDNLNVMFGMYHPEGGSSGEMKMEWVDIGSKKTPQLQVFDDAWDALGLFPDLITELATLDSKDINDDEFCIVLDRLGFKDITPYEDPNKEIYKKKEIDIQSETKEVLQYIISNFSEYTRLAQGTNKCEAIIKAEQLLDKLLNQ
jgi:hypothetical protein